MLSIISLQFPFTYADMVDLVLCARVSIACSLVSIVCSLVSIACSLVSIVCSRVYCM